MIVNEEKSITFKYFMQYALQGISTTALGICFYLHEVGIASKLLVEGSFNRAFGDLKASDKEANLAIAKAVPFAGTNENLIECRFPGESKMSNDMWKLLMGIRECGLKNDAMLDIFYDLVMEHVQISGPYSIILFHGVYDIPQKGSDKQRLGDSLSVTNANVHRVWRKS